MIERLEVRNFQSLHHVVLDLAPFTVIVGPSDSGKSAFTRAIRTLTSNKRGVDFITHGERIATISAVTDRGHVTLKRGRGTNDNEYVVIPTDSGHPLYPRREMTKLGGVTPPEVSEFIGIESADPINYAGQLDKPYLLDDTGGEVARTLGALTNVNVIFEAAREANRRTLANSATLRTRAGDLAAVREKVPTYAGLKAQLAAIERAEEFLDTARKLLFKISKIRSAIEAIVSADTVIAQLSTIAVREIPDEQAILTAYARLSAYRKAVQELKDAGAAELAARVAIDAQAGTEQELAEQWNETLKGISGGIIAHWIDKAETLEDVDPNRGATIETHEGSQLAADYIAGILAE